MIAQSVYTGPASLRPEDDSCSSSGCELRKMRLGVDVSMFHIVQCFT